MHIQALPPGVSKRPFHCRYCSRCPHTSIIFPPSTETGNRRRSVPLALLGSWGAFTGYFWGKLLLRVASIGSSSDLGWLELTQLLPLEERNKSCGYLEPLVDPHIMVPRLHVPCWDIKQDVEVLPQEFCRLCNYRLLGCCIDWHSNILKSFYTIPSCWVQQNCTKS